MGRCIPTGITKAKEPNEITFPVRASIPLGGGKTHVVLYREVYHIDIKPH